MPRTIFGKQFYFKLSYITFIYIWSFATISAQDLTNAQLSFEEIKIPSWKGVHSSANALFKDKIIAIGGRTEGIHAINPADTFKKESNNNEIIIIDKNNWSIKRIGLTDLDSIYQAQLQSTNMLSYQEGKYLIIVGGYAQDYLTGYFDSYPYLVVVDLEILLERIENNRSINPAFTRIKDDRFCITGGEMGKINNNYLLVGGMKFSGIYNGFDMPSFEQEYTEQVRQFKILTFNPLKIQFTNTYFGGIDLHRRDFNLVSHIFPNQKDGYLLSSGVFQLNENLPWLHPVSIHSDSYTIDTTFNQLLSHYHSANISFYSKKDKEMSHIFLGGIAEYYFRNDTLIKDIQVPFVKTISLLKQDSLSHFSEFSLSSQMPKYMGANARFILDRTIPKLTDEIVDLDAINNETLLIGYIFGGIESREKHPFFNRRHKNSRSSTSIYKVFMNLK